MTTHNMSKIKRIVGITLFGIALLSLITACAGSPAKRVGVVDNIGLNNCPKKPNCVVSHDKDNDHFIKPITHSGSQDQAGMIIVDIINQMEGSKIIAVEKIENKAQNRSAIYIRAEFTSKWLKFVDDVEFLIEDNTVQVRSASRFGYSDLGVNRQRVETVRKLFDKELATATAK